MQYTAIASTGEVVTFALETLPSNGITRSKEALRTPKSGRMALLQDRLSAGGHREDLAPV
jgi:hypothetical protein